MKSDKRSKERAKLRRDIKHLREIARVNKRNHGFEDKEIERLEKALKEL